MADNSDRDSSPAIRVQAAVKKMFDISENESIARTWSKAFGIEGQNRLLRFLASYTEQVEAVEKALKARGAPSDLYAPCLKHVRLLAHVENLSQAWQGVKKDRLKPETLLALSWIVFYLPREEVQVPAETLESIKAQLADLEAMLTASDLGDFLRSFIQERVTEIRAALEDYAIGGSAKVEDVVRQGVGALQQHRAEIEQEAAASTEASSAVSKLKAAYRGCVSVLSDADKVRKGVSAVNAALSSEGARKAIAWMGEQLS